MISLDSKLVGGNPMERNQRLSIVLLIVLFTVLISACGQGSSSTLKKEDPSKVEEIPGSDLKRVLLTEKAAERLGIQTAMVGEAQLILKQTVVGEVVEKRGASPTSPNELWVRAQFNETDFKLVAREKHARILILNNQDDVEDSDEEENDWSAELDEASGLDNDEDNDNDDTALYYVVDRTKTGLVTGQRVFVEVAFSGDRTHQIAIPYAALIYDVHGGTWVYVKEPNALSFYRESVTVDYIKGDLAYLTESPPVGTEVVTVGGAELYGAETGVSK
jgi:hypothetical protein